MTLYHYTCDHAAVGIFREGVVRPGSELGVPFPQSRFAWFTNLDTPVRDALGLSDVIAKCDRLARRFIVSDETRVWSWMALRPYLPSELVSALEGTPGAMPMHWWVSADAVPVTTS